MSFIIRIPSTACPFITGLSPSYSENFPKELTPYITPSIYISSIRELNDMLSLFWPCLPARLFGYFCCPFTLGLSLLIPSSCIQDAEVNLKREINRLNFEIFLDKGLKLRYKKEICCSSCLEIQVGGKEIEIIKTPLLKY